VLAGQGWGAWPVCSRKAGARGEAASQRSAPARTVAAPPAVAPQKVRLSAPATTGDYVVKRGDTLSGIDASSGVAGGWQALVQKNPELAADPDLISPGQRITV
jgi:nucleoid-associated protein YgaU